MSNLEQDRARFLAIQQQVRELNTEAEKLVLAHQEEKSEDNTEGYGKCTYYVTCGCQSYLKGDTPGICDRSHCTHPASDHEF